jgi:phage I-like protein
MGASEVPLLPDGNPPSEFRVFRAGPNPSDYGEIIFDAKAAEMVMGEVARKGNPLFFDWNHGSELPKAQKTRENAAAAGQFKPFIRDGELWVSCEWNADGFEDVKKRRYNLFSPTFPYDDTDGVIRPCGLSSIALLNRAGLDHIDRIAAGAASTDHEGDHAMNEAEIKKLQDDLRAANERIVSLEAKDRTRGVLALGAILGLGSAATDEERVEAVKGIVLFREKALSLSGAKTADEALVVITAWKDSHGKVAELAAKEEARASLALQADFDAIVAGAVKELKIDVAKAEEFKANELARMGGKLTAAGIDGTKKLVALMHAKGNPVGAGPREPKRGEKPVISAEQKQLLELHGFKVETAEKALAAEQVFLEARARQIGTAA